LVQPQRSGWPKPTALRGKLDMRTGIICCWHEFGECSVVEPTKIFDMQYLERVKNFFGEYARASEPRGRVDLNAL
jgi:hypothetical protein